jgi:hypothetical protein
MNERMYELINQCFIGTTDGKLSELNTVANVEKFAVLIVRECANLFEIEWGDEKLTGNDVGYVVKKHFGVEG